VRLRTWYEASFSSRGGSFHAPIMVSFFSHAKALGRSSPTLSLGFFWCGNMLALLGNTSILDHSIWENCSSEPPHNLGFGLVRIKGSVVFSRNAVGTSMGAPPLLGARRVALLVPPTVATSPLQHGGGSSMAIIVPPRSRRRALVSAFGTCFHACHGSPRPSRFRQWLET